MGAEELCASFEHHVRQKPRGRFSFTESVVSVVFFLDNQQTDTEESCVSSLFHPASFASVCLSFLICLMDIIIALFLAG